MRKAGIAIILPLLVFCLGINTFAQGNKIPETHRGYLLEVAREHGSPPTYQTLEQNSTYGAWRALPGWSSKPGEAPVQGISLRPRVENGTVKISVVVARGEYLGTQEVIDEYVIGETVTVLKAMTKVGIVPFEVRLVQAASTIASLPVVENRTRSLAVTVEPVSSTLPSFKVKVVNLSPKPVTAWAFQTIFNGKVAHVGTPWNTNGGDLIAPGELYESTLRYPSNPVTEKSGDHIPDTEPVLKLQIRSVVFNDGTYEGDPAPAARFRGRKFGEKTQLQRIVALLNSAAALSPETLAPKADELSYRISLSEVMALSPEFPELPAAEWELVRGTAELSAHNFQKEFKSTFGTASKVPPAKFHESVRSVMTRCEARINSLP